MKKTKRIIIFLSVLLFVFLVIFFLFSTKPHPDDQSILDRVISHVCFNQHCFEVEIADNAFKRTIGLMNREKLPHDKGMLFIFQKQGIYSFWMKDTLIPLDIIWLDKNKKVVFIKENAQPCKEFFCPSIDPGVSAQYVLEINAGLVEKIGLKKGSELIFKNLSF